MSLANLKEYAMRCANEPELRDRAKAIGIADVDEHMRHAESLGLDWTIDDMIAFRKEVIDADDDFSYLTEDELEQVSGGVFSCTAAIAISVGVGVGIAAGVGAGAAAGAGAATAAGDGGW